MNIMAMRWGKLYRGTPAELALEDAVAELGVPYRTQFPGYLYGFRFFPDFFLPTLNLIIEVDDSSHTRTKKIVEDAERTEMLEARGWQVVRCTNDEALNDPRGTVRALLQSVGMWPIPERLPSLRGSLPSSQKCPPRARRKAQSERRASARRTPQRPSSKSGHPRRRGPAVEPTPVAAPPDEAFS